MLRNFLLVRLVDRYFGGVARGEPAIGGEHQALFGHVFHGLFDAQHDGLGIMIAAAIDAPQADAESLGKTGQNACRQPPGW